jgi:3-oxoacyl-[acyl-carrier-protein] synthase II
VPEPIAITGVGLTTCLGVGVEANWEALRNGRSGLGRVTRFEVADYPVQAGGEAPALPGREAAQGERSFENRHLLAAIREACDGAGFAGGRLPTGARAALAVGSSLAGSSTSERFFADYVRLGAGGASGGASGVDYGLLASYYAEEQLGLIGAQLGLEGPAVLVSNACAAGASSIAEAARWLRGERADIAVAAGYDPLSVFTFAGFGSLMALSRTRVRPFDAARDGMLLGDGFAALVLETAASARRAGRRVLAWLAGYGESTDAHHLTHPHPQGAGAALAMRRALAMSELEPAAIDYINCHGTGTRPNDLAETRAMRSVFGAALESIPVSSSKPFFGHTLGGAGAVEAVVTALAVREGVAPANLYLENLDPELGSLDVVREARAMPIRRAMSNSFGFGGANTSLVFAREDAA